MNTIHLATTVFVSALLLSGKKQQPKDSPLKPIVFEKIIYHTTQCFGDCPIIDLEVDSNYDVYLCRFIYANTQDSAKSGFFKGKIDPHTYFNLTATIISSDYEHLKFPATFCCDAPIQTIIIYANGKRTRLSSMTAPEEARKLIDSLYNLAVEIDIPRTNEKINIEK